MIRRGLCIFALGLAVMSCEQERSRGAQPLRFDAVEPLFSRACTDCHQGPDPAAGIRLSSYYETLGCTGDGSPLPQAQAGRAALAAVFDRPDHAQLLSTDEQRLVRRWLEAGAAGPASAVHGPHILDPRSDAWHGRLAAEDRFAPLREPEAEAVCGRCHEGAPVRPSQVSSPAPGAPSCTSCHTKVGGVLACSTCHGNEERAYPPRDACYFESAAHDAHRAHLSSTRVRQEPLPCTTCHALPGAELFAGTHVDGRVQVQFSALAGEDAEFDAENHSCTVQCHARGGSQPTPSFQQELALGCDGCHTSPPRDHYAGPCSTCHVEMGMDAQSLRPGPLHLNGQLDVGNGDGSCAACHGSDDSPWPADRSHRAHRDSLLTAPISCETCHAVPARVNAPGHLNGVVEVTLSGRALGRDGRGAYDTANRRCGDAACHAGPLQARAVAPTWNEVPMALGCATCHEVPPPPPHIQQTACGGGLCHRDEVRGAAPYHGITERGTAVHIDGVLQAAGL